MTDTCEGHSYFLELNSPGMVGRITSITEERVFYKVYKLDTRAILSCKKVILIGEDSYPKDKFFKAIEDGRLQWTERPLGG